MKTNGRRWAWYGSAGIILCSLGVACTGEVGGGDMMLDPGGGGSSGSTTGTSASGTGSSAATSSGTATAGSTNGTNSTGGTGSTVSTTGTCIAGCGTTGSTGSTTATTTGGTSTCTPSAALFNRLVRLDNNKVTNTVKSLLGATALTTPTAVNQLPDSGDELIRQFNPLLTEGDFYSVDTLSPVVNLIEGGIANITTAQLVTLLGCTATLADACVTAGLPKFAAKANRVAALDAGATSLATLYTTLKAGGSSVEEAARYAVEAAMLVPQSLYRTEIGQPVAAGAMSTTLTPYELESELSYFLTDAPPDATGMAAATGLTTQAAIQTEVDRLLKLPSAIENLDQVMATYFNLGAMSLAIKDPTDFPNFNSGVLAAMYTESDTFIRKTLPTGKLTDLLTSKTTYLNTTLATYYGAGTVPNATLNTFAPFMFPASQPRQGVLSQGGILAMRGRPTALDVTVVSRGLYVNGSVLCIQKPPSPPTDATTQMLLAMQRTDPTQTENQKADFRATTSPCNGCHATFDPYGRALLNFDGAGAYRTTYPNGAAVDATTTLPASAGGAMIQNVVDMENQVSQTGLFTGCIGTNLLKYAYMQPSPNLTSSDCLVSDINTAFQGTDQSFYSMVRTVALSNALSVRSVGGP